MVIFLIVDVVLTDSFIKCIILFAGLGGIFTVLVRGEFKVLQFFLFILQISRLFIKQVSLVFGFEISLEEIQTNRAALYYKISVLL